MPINTIIPTKDQINELRNRFIEKYEKNPPAEPFHPVDIDRVKNEDTWCGKFLEMYDADMNISFEKLWETCIWRKKYGAYDLNETNLRKEYLTDGVVFPRNKDIEGKPILIFKTKLHQKGVKDMDEVIRVVVYWIERIHRETNMEKITIFFDMAGTGIGNMDLDFVKRIIETFKLYYPNALNYILIYEMAWVLNAAFKIIKGFLPPKALEILKMITKKDITTYVDKNNCLACWGGNDNYEFNFVPEQMQKKPTTITSMSTSVKVNGDTPSTALDDQLNGNDKKVHFANSSPTREVQMTDFEDQHHTPEDYDMLRISPNEFIHFSRGENNESNVELTCISKFPVTYKIQTTSPEKFRVRPRCGVLSPGDTIPVSILLKPEHHLAEGSKDKFLVMCMRAANYNMTPQQVTEVWKQKVANTPEVEQHRLCCIYKNASEPAMLRNGIVSTGGEVGSDGKGSSAVADLSKHAKHLEDQLKFTQLLQCVTLVLLLALSVAVVYLLKETGGSAAGASAVPSAASTPACTKGRFI